MNEPRLFSFSTETGLGSWVAGSRLTDGGYRPPGAPLWSRCLESGRRFFFGHGAQPWFGPPPLLHAVIAAVSGS